MLFILSVVGLAILAFGPDKYVYADGLPASVPEPSMAQAVDAPVGVVDETVSSFTTEAGSVSPEINPTSLGSTETLTDNQNNGDDKPTV